MADVLVVNSGSSSMKYAVLDPTTGQRRLQGIQERIGEPGSACGDHQEAFAFLRAELAEQALTPELIGHRVVHGGDYFTAPALIDQRVIAAIEACVPLAPLHNPAALAGIHAARAVFPGVAQVAVFDTAFHTTIPEAARRYAIDARVAEEFRLLRYGFHGTSHQYVAGRAAHLLDLPLHGVNLVTLHLGNGASACAVRGGLSVETSMGVTPLEGLVMGTRSGDVDPAIPLMLVRSGYTTEEVDGLLNRSSGLVGICGDNDMRTIHLRAQEGDEAADLARAMFVHRLRKYLGAYLAVLGRVDGVVFTAGIGEHDWWVREQVCADLEAMGIAVAPDLNRRADSGERLISEADSPVAVMVIPTDEELAIAGQAWGVARSTGQQ